MRREGEEGLAISNSTRIHAVEAEKLLMPFAGKTIVDAARFYVAHLESLSSLCVTVRQLVDEYLREVESNERSTVHLNDLRGRYEALCGLGDSRPER